jgi:aminoglycoside 6'-N-acetyltransferase
MEPAREPTVVRLRPATGEDVFLIRRWLADPGVQRWWGSRASAEAEITLALASQTALCRVVMRENGPIGYVQAVDDGPHAGAEAGQLAGGIWNIAFFVAPAADAGDAAILRAVPALIAEEVFATTLAVACSGLVSIAQEAVVRAYEHAGFRWQRIWRDPLLGPAWLMLKERPYRP